MDRGLADRLVGVAEERRGPSTARAGSSIRQASRRRCGAAAATACIVATVARASARCASLRSGRASASIARRCTAGRGSPSSSTQSCRHRIAVADRFQSSRPRGSSILGTPLRLDAIDRAEHVGLVELRGRAAELVPAAGIDDDQAAVGVFEHVGRVEVEVGAGDEVFVLGRERRSLGRQDVPADLVQVEVAGEQVVLIFLAEGVRLVAGQAARGGRAQVQQDRHDLGAGPLVGGLEDRVVDLAVDAAVDRVDQAVALAAAGM